MRRALYFNRFFEPLPAGALLIQIDYGGPLRDPWPLQMQIHMQNESDDDSVPALISDSESSEDEDYDFPAAG